MRRKKFRRNKLTRLEGNSKKKKVGSQRITARRRGKL